MANFKIWAVARKKANLVKIGRTKDDASWFFLSEPVVKFLGGGSNELQGKELDGYESAWNNNVKGELITKVYLPKTDQHPKSESPAKKAAQAMQATSTPRAVNKNNNDDIIRATAQTVQALQGLVDPNNIKEVITIIYNTYKDLMNA